MSFFDLLTLFGGLAMFLYGMRLMGTALRESSSGTLKAAMGLVTNNPIKAFLLGVFITATIQSSTATIVITAGLVGGGILTLHQSLGIIIGANVGTTVTGQIIRLLDLDASGGASWLRIFQPSSLAPLALIAGIVLIMGFHFKNSQSIGNIAIGFGILFSGLLNMTGAVSALTESGIVEQLFTGLGDNPFLGYVTGAGIAFVLQSSSATIGILQAFSASGLLTFKAIYAVIVGIYLGDCITTGIVCSLGTSDSESKRVGIVNIMFNLSETVLVLLVVTVIHRLGFLDGLWDKTVTSGMIANTNTIFNLSCAVLLFPMLGLYEKASRKIVRDTAESEDKYRSKLDALSPTFYNTPALALHSCYDLLLTIFRSSHDNLEKALPLLKDYDEEIYQEILEEEENIDRLTDRASRYIVDLLPYMKEERHAAILAEYYKVVEEFERLGDGAEHIANIAANLHQMETTFSETAFHELDVLHQLVERVLELTEQAFEKRNIQAALDAEPLVQVAGDMVVKLKRNHLERMSKGDCNIYVDASYTNLLSEMKRIADGCSNVGVAVVIRSKPDLADHEHDYFARLRSGNNKRYNQGYKKAHEEYYGMLGMAAENGF